ncbi:MAG: TetR family transcriptional regulator [Micromonosporaceae bacterium]|nr:TetR family transcriptional regulator [Micromonosporaceae bacterium]
MTGTPATRRRAPAMSPEERRATIIEAALPLLAEHGTQVTTSQVATAASIAEGTVFRVFRDKQDLIDQCVRQALRPEEGLAAVSAVPRDLPLEVRLRVAAHRIADRVSRIGALMHALSATGYRVERMHDERWHADRQQWIQDTTEALAELIGPEADRLRLPAERVAQVFLGVVFSSQFAGQMRGCQDNADDAHAMNELIDVFLRGVLTEETGKA